MDETRDRCLAAILARGLIRVRQRAERAGTWKPQDNDQPQTPAADARTDDQPSVNEQAGQPQGEQ